MGLSDRTAAAAAAHAGLSLTSGQKVLDAVTGLVGVVLGGVSVHRAIVDTEPGPGETNAALFKVPELELIEVYKVKLSTSYAVEREGRELIAIPANVSEGLDEFV